ncbi:MAG: malonyl-CoA decarboxylase [Hyphomicrobiaceae bacterium]|nr:malonyl-CoA decarboxylase [Hyphomicrobiaceae bacterium]
MNVSFFQELLTTVAEQGRALLPKSLFGPNERDDVQELARALISGRGEASGVAIARALLDRYRVLAPEERTAFFRYLSETMQPDAGDVAAASRAYLAEPGNEALGKLRSAVEGKRQELFRRLNLAPGATAQIVAMRNDLLNEQPRPDLNLTGVDADLRHLFQSWFNRGFLVLRRIDWQTPASILEKIIAYEAVHEISGWDDLRRRLDPVDRRCFAFFHPSLIDDPLIFVEVALTTEVPAAIAPLLKGDRKLQPGEAPTTAVFYSISNCQPGLRGISFGNFLLKQVVEDLAREIPSLKTFVTLSPVPHFARWLDRLIASDPAGVISPEDRETLTALLDPRWHRATDTNEDLQEAVLAQAAQYFLAAKSADNRPGDPVARFHLGNGARLERINWLADTSEKGLRAAHGVMVNYRYDLKEIERNHEAYANDGTVAASRAVKALLRAPPKTKAITADAPAKPLLALSDDRPVSRGKDPR